MLVVLGPGSLMYFAFQLLFLLLREAARQEQLKGGNIFGVSLLQLSPHTRRAPGALGMLCLMFTAALDCHHMKSHSSSSSLLRFPPSQHSWETGSWGPGRALTNRLRCHFSLVFQICTAG